MQVNGIPNKFKVFQDFYFQTKGVEISYREALRLFYQMDEDTEMDFVEYYSMESGIPIQYKKVQQVDKYGNLVYDDEGNPVYDEVPMDPFKFANGYNLDMDFALTEAGKIDLARYTKSLLNTKYTIEAYAAKRGLVLDPIWSQYSAEEIIQMENEGVDIPQDIIDIAHSIYEGSPDNLEGGEDIEGQGEKTTEKTPFLDLIPLAKKHIEKCDDTNEKIEDKIDDLLESNRQTRRSILDKIEEQRASLKEYEEKVREWRKLQDKINNGEALTDSEARKYAQITGMLQDKNKNDSDFKFDKIKIATTLNEINVLAVLGEKLADETVEIGENLEDYTCKKNYKTTQKSTMHQIGFLRAIIAMIIGKRIGEQAVETGNDTKEYTDESSDSVRDIAQLMGIEKMIANPSTDSVEAPEDEAVQDDVDKTTDEVQTEPAPAEDTPTVDEGQAAGDVQEKTEGENTEQAETEEDFIINDENVLGLIDETKKIDRDLAKQIVVALSDWKAAKDDAAFAKFATKLIDRMVAEYQQEEAIRQQEIDTKQQEIEEAQKEIDELSGGKEKDESQKTAEKFGIKVDEEKDKENTEDDDEIAKNKQIIEQNTADIEALKEESAKAVDNVKERTAPIKEKIDESVVNEAKSLENDTKYKDEIIPAGKERIDFTDASGETLMKMGKYRVIVGHELLAAAGLFGPLYVLGMKHIVRGTKSMFIGGAAKIVSNTKIPEISDKATGKAVEKENTAIEGLTALDSKIVGVTGEQAAEDKVVETENSEGEGAQDGNEEGAEGAQDNGENGVSDSTNGEAAPVNETAEAPNNAAQTNPPAEEAPVEETQNTIVEEGKKPAEEQKPEEAENPEESAEDEAENATEEAVNSPETNKSGSSGGSKPELSPEDEAKAAGANAKKEEKTQKKETDKQNKEVKDANKSAKDGAKESKKIEKDEKKDAKQLEKEAKKIEQTIQRDEQEIIRMTKESQDAAQKQAEYLARYEQVVAENETLAAQEEQKQMNKPAQTQQPQNQDQQNDGLAMNSFGMTDSSMGTTSDNTEKLEANNQVITELSGKFTVAGNKITRNKVKITKMEKSIKKNTKKFEKKVKIKQKKIKQTQKKEQQKAKRLQKQLAAVGIAENIFSITNTTGTVLVGVGGTMTTTGGIMIATGTPMLSNPFTAAAGAALISTGTVLETNGGTMNSVGQVLEKIGKFGTLACGVTKATINIANGNLAAGLMALGQTAIAAVSSMTGTGAAANNVFGYVSQGLSVVSNTAQLVNNVRVVQGKEANGVMSKIGTVAGVGSALVGAAEGFSGGGFKDASLLGKAAKIGSAAGTAMTSASQIMTEFKLGDEKTANILGSIGGGLSTVSSVAQLTTKLEKKDDGTNGAANNNEGNGGENDEPAGPNVNKIDDNGTIHLSDGSTVAKDGTRTYPDGRVVKAEPVTKNSDGSFTTKDGKTYNSKGEEIDGQSGKPITNEKKQEQEQQQVAEQPEDKVVQVASAQTNSNTNAVKAAETATAIEATSKANDGQQQQMNNSNRENTQTVQQSEQNETDKVQKAQVEQKKTEADQKKAVTEVKQAEKDEKKAASEAKKAEAETKKAEEQQKQDEIKEAKEAQKAKTEEAKELTEADLQDEDGNLIKNLKGEDVTLKDAKENMIKSGASKEFAAYDDEMLDDQITKLEAEIKAEDIVKTEGNENAENTTNSETSAETENKNDDNTKKDEKLKKLKDEKTARSEYKEKMEVLDSEEDKPSTMDKISKAAEVFGGLANAASSFLQQGASAQTNKSKKIVGFEMTKRMQKIMKEHRDAMNRKVKATNRVRRLRA